MTSDEQQHQLGGAPSTEAPYSPRPTKDSPSLLDQDEEEEGYGEDDMEDVQKKQPSVQTTTNPTATSFIVAANNDESTTATPPPSFDAFLRKGTRLKTWMADALTELSSTVAAARPAVVGNKRPRTEQLQQNNNDETPVRDVGALARETTARVLDLQRQLKDALVQTETLQASNAALRQENSMTQQRLDKATQTVRWATENASKARADADAAEATAASLACQLQSLQTVVTETKRASQLLQTEQEQVAAACSSLETKWVSTQQQLLQAQQELERHVQEHQEHERAADKWKREKAQLERTVEQQSQQLHDQERQYEKLKAMEKMREERTTATEREWLQAQQSLVEISQAQATAAETEKVLQEAVTKLKAAAEQQQEQTEQQLSAYRARQERLETALTTAEQQAQKLHLDKENVERQMERVLAEKTALEQQVAVLKKKKPDVLTAAATTTPKTRVSPDGSSQPKSAVQFRLPPLAGAGKENSNASSGVAGATPNNNTGQQQQQCCICFRPASGMMKACQCGGKGCCKRAHAVCLANITPGPSVSHPGTPAPRLPVILCGTVTPVAAHHTAAPME